MSNILRCRLCLENCSEHKILYDENGGRNTELYCVMRQSLHPKYLTIAKGNKLTAICLTCCSRVTNFNEFKTNFPLTPSNISECGNNNEAITIAEMLSPPKGVSGTLPDENAMVGESFEAEKQLGHNPETITTKGKDFNEIIIKEEDEDSDESDCNTSIKSELSSDDDDGSDDKELSLSDYELKVESDESVGTIVENGEIERNSPKSNLANGTSAKQTSLAELDNMMNIKNESSEDEAKQTSIAELDNMMNIKNESSEDEDENTEECEESIDVKEEYSSDEDTDACDEEDAVGVLTNVDDIAKEKESMDNSQPEMGDVTQLDIKIEPTTLTVCQAEMVCSIAAKEVIQEVEEYDARNADDHENEKTKSMTETSSNNSIIDNNLQGDGAQGLAKENAKQSSDKTLAKKTETNKSKISKKTTENSKNKLQSIKAYLQKSNLKQMLENDKPKEATNKMTAGNNEDAVIFVSQQASVSSNVSNKALNVSKSVKENKSKESSNKTKTKFTSIKDYLLKTSEKSKQVNKTNESKEILADKTTESLDKRTSNINLAEKSTQNTSNKLANSRKRSRRSSNASPKSTSPETDSLTERAKNNPKRSKITKAKSFQKPASDDDDEENDLQKTSTKISRKRTKRISYKSPTTSDSEGDFNDEVSEKENIMKENNIKSKRKDENKSSASIEHKKCSNDNELDLPTTSKLSSPKAIRKRIKPISYKCSGTSESEPDFDDDDVESLYELSGQESQSDSSQSEDETLNEQTINGNKRKRHSSNNSTATSKKRKVSKATDTDNSNTSSDISVIQPKNTDTDDSDTSSDISVIQPKDNLKKQQAAKLPQILRQQDYDDLIAQWKPMLDCGICQESYDTFTGISVHFSSKHDNEKPFIICCDLKLTTRPQIAFHGIGHMDANDIYYPINEKPSKESRPYKCRICDKTYRSSVDLREHVSKHTDTHLYKCVVCSQTFRYRSILYDHLKEKHPKKWSTIRLTGRAYETMQVLTDVSKETLKFKEASGKKCTTKLYDDKRKFAKTLDCPLCDNEKYLYSTWADLGAHFKEHHPEENCYTECCNRTFYHREILTDHARVHFDPDYLTCKFCGKSYGRGSDFQKHLRDVHTADPKNSKEATVAKPRNRAAMDAEISAWKPNLECGICQETSPNFTNLSQHFFRQHPNKAAHIVCCNRKFLRREQIADHVVYHKDKNAYKCEICHKCCFFRHDLYKHMWRKHSVKPDGKAVTKRIHKCKVCKETFANPQTLRDHMTVHTGEYLYQCGLCAQPFGNRPSVYDHLQKKHTMAYEQRAKNPDQKLVEPYKGKSGEKSKK